MNIVIPMYNRNYMLNNQIYKLNSCINYLVNTAYDFETVENIINNSIQQRKKYESKAELASIKAELNAIIKEMEGISIGIRNNFKGIGNENAQSLQIRL